MIIDRYKDSLNGHHMIEKETKEDRKPIGETRLTSMQEKHGQNMLRTETWMLYGIYLCLAVINA